MLLIGYEMYRLLSLSVPSLGGNKMATKRKKKTAAKLAAASGATIDLDHNEKEMESLMGELHGVVIGGVLRVGVATIDLDHNGKEMESLMGEWVWQWVES